MGVEPLVPEAGNLSGFVKQFEVFARTPNGISKIKDLITYFAVSGKLVEQLKSSDAKIDFKRNQDEKQRLLKKKVIKVKKKMPEIDNDEIPYSIPPSWVWTRIGEVSNYGIAVKAEFSDVVDDTWVLELEDIEKESSKLLSKVTAKDRNFKSSKNRFDKGDVLYGKLRPYLDKVIVADEKGVCSTEVIPLHGFSNIDPYYLRWMMKSPYFKEYAENSTHGMRMPRLGTEKALVALFPFPPLEEQKRIVAKVGELMALCDKLEAQQQQQANTVLRANTAAINALLNPSTPETSFEQNWQRIAQHFNTLYGCTLPMPKGEGRKKKHLVGLENVKALRNVLLQLAVDGRITSHDNKDLSLINQKNILPVGLHKIGKGKSINYSEPISEQAKQIHIANNWLWLRLGQIVAIVGGSQPPKSKFTYEKTEGYTRLIQIRDFRTDNFITYVPNEYANRLFYKKDVMIGRYGPPVFQILRGLEGTYNVALMKAIPNEKFIINDYLFYFLKSPNIQSLVVAESERTAGQSGVRKELLYEYIMPLPPLEEQKRIVAKVDQLMTLCDQLEQQLTQSYSDAEKLMQATVKALVA